MVPHLGLAGGVALEGVSVLVRRGGFGSGCEQGHSGVSSPSGRATLVRAHSVGLAV